MTSTYQNLSAPSGARSPTTTACSEETFEIVNLDSGTEFPRDPESLLDSDAGPNKKKSLFCASSRVILAAASGEMKGQYFLKF